MPHTTLILGAGFTRAFYTDAPLMVGDYDCEELARSFRPFGEASRILDAEFERNGGYRINIERLFTRLEGRMPYDFQPGVPEQLAHLLAEVRRRFVDRLLRSIRGGPGFGDELRELAVHCLNHHVDMITFNYDDALDKALFDVSNGGAGSTASAGWWPADGYGFPCPSADRNEVHGLTRSEADPLLLKLHGSLSWLARRGTPNPYPVDAMYHWWYHPAPPPPGSVLLEREPLIVPPVLVKSALTEQPVLREVWTHARRVLAASARVIFVGYSMPVTDIGAKTLFAETLVRTRPAPEIEVVGWIAPGADDLAREQEQNALRRNYRDLFPGLPDDHFRFDGARAWAQNFAAQAP